MISLHSSQEQVAKDTARFRVVCCGRRWGKTTLSTLEMFAFANARKQSKVVYVAPSIKQARDIAWAMLKKSTNACWAKEPNETRLELFIKDKHGTVSEIWLRGAENIESLRGLKIDFLVVDEVASMGNWDSTWSEVLRPTLTDSKGQALFISTPKGRNHFWRLFDKEKEDTDYKSFKFTSYDNPYIPADEIDKARQELDETIFQQEYMAEFKNFTGLVYKDFSRERHVIEPVELRPNWTYFRAIDFGWVHPTAVVFFALTDKGILYQYDEIYHTQLKTPDLAELIKQKTAGRMMTQTYADSAQQSDIAELQKYGMGVLPVSKTSGSGENYTVFKIRKVTEKLRNASFFVFKNCVNTIDEFEKYKYKEVNEGGVVKEEPAKMDDHALDAIAYLITSIPDHVEPTMGDDYKNIQLPKEKLFTGGFY